MRRYGLSTLKWITTSTGRHSIPRKRRKQRKRRELSYYYWERNNRTYFFYRNSTPLHFGGGGQPGAVRPHILYSLFTLEKEIYNTVEVTVLNNTTLQLVYWGFCGIPGASPACLHRVQLLP